MKRHYLVAALTVVLVALTLLTVKFGLGWKSFLPERKEGSLRRDPVFWAKFTQINSLPPIGRKRPYTEQEMNLLRRAIVDSNKYIRVVAISALEEAKHDPKQREEAVKLIVPLLKDSEWIVRSYAVTALARLNARETVFQILPLLNDPKPEVREDARKALEKLGYQVKRNK